MASMTWNICVQLFSCARDSLRDCRKRPVSSTPSTVERRAISTCQELEPRPNALAEAFKGQRPL